jgi:plastocyanin
MTHTAKSIATTFGMILLLAFAMTLVAACGGDDAGTGDATAVASAVPPEDDAHEDDEAAPAAANVSVDHGLEGGALAVQAARVIEMEWIDFAFLPARITIKAGEVVHFNVNNSADNAHDISIDKIDANIYVVLQPDSGEHAGMEEMEVDLDFSMARQGRGAFQLRVNEPGEYVYYCTIPGHREAGMEGILIVEAADA